MLSFTRRFQSLNNFAVGRFKHSKTAAAANAQLIFIRHGEKPGAIPNDQPTDPSYIGLTDAGWARAKRLPSALLSWTSNNTTEGVRIFAMQQKVKKDGTGHSRRPIETVIFLGDQLSLGINSDFAKGDYQGISSFIFDSKGSFAGKSVVIAWEHTDLTQVILQGFKVPEPIPGLFTWSTTDTINPNNTTSIAFSKIIVANFGSDGSLQKVQVRDQDDLTFVKTFDS